MEPGQGLSYCGGRGSSYSGLLLHTVNELVQTVLGNPLDPTFHLPRAYTWELTSIEYLYSQTGRAVQEIGEEEEEETAGSSQEEEEEKFDMEGDLTIPEADFLSIPVRPTERPEASAKRPPSGTARTPSSPRAVWRRGAVRSTASAKDVTESEPPLLEAQPRSPDETPSLSSRKV